MLIEHNIAVPMRDGAELRCNVFRPESPGRFPVVMTFGPYGKDVPLQQFMAEAWNTLNKHYPEILAASSCKHLVFERPDPEVWVRDGFILINVDSRSRQSSTSGCSTRCWAAIARRFLQRCNALQRPSSPVPEDCFQ